MQSCMEMASVRGSVFPDMKIVCGVSFEKR